MRRHPFSRPVAQLHRRVGAELIEVEDVTGVEHRHPSVLAEGVDEPGEVRLGERDELAVPAGADREPADQRPDRVATIADGDRAAVEQRGQEP